MKTFAEVVVEQLRARGNKKGRRERRLLKLLESPRSAIRDRRIRRLERHARIHLEDEHDFTVGDDWGVVKERDWSAFFKSLLEFLLAILPLILPLLLKKKPVAKSTPRRKAIARR